MRKPISFIVIAHQNQHTLNRCLESVEQEWHEQDELILVLNNPDAQTKTIALSRNKWKVLFESKPGPQHARNCGAKDSINQLLCFLDADVFIPPKWSQVMAENFKNPFISAGQSSIELEQKQGLLNSVKRYAYLKFVSRFYLKPGEFQNPTFISLDTAAMMVRKEWFDRVNGFSPKFSRMEDTDFSLRILYHGGDIFFEERIKAMELFDPRENLASFIYKQYLSMKLLNLFYFEHQMRLDLSLFSFRKRESCFRNISYFFKLWEICLHFIVLLGTINGEHYFQASPKFIKYIPHPKKKFLDPLSKASERSIWVGGVEKIYDLEVRRFFRQK
ncbi:MAG: glycosyltransferase family 2 protein [Bdellovibrionales bacterium]|nr:glycosyltransferase family 2 protein [Bdellovibrionales bacterium]